MKRFSWRPRPRIIQDVQGCVRRHSNEYIPYYKPQSPGYLNGIESIHQRHNTPTKTPYSLPRFPSAPKRQVDTLNRCMKPHKRRVWHANVGSGGLDGNRSETTRTGEGCVVELQDLNEERKREPVPGSVGATYPVEGSMAHYITISRDASRPNAR